MKESFSRRAFFTGALGAAALTRGLRGESAIHASTSRVERAMELRRQAAERQARRPVPYVDVNGDEDAFAGRAGCYTKGMTRTQTGEVDAAAYESLLAALRSQDFDAFERLP